MLGVSRACGCFGLVLFLFSLRGPRDWEWVRRTASIACYSLPRLDVLLVEKGLAASRQRAVGLVTAGRVLVDGLPAKKAGQRLDPERNVTVEGGDFIWVGRGALKLLGALASFPALSVSGAVCADLGSSTGGFTEVLLQHGAVRVYAVDVGTGQLAPRLREDSRVVVMEETNVRYLETLPEAVDLVVADLSFISLSKVLPVIHRLLCKGGEAVLLVKPQFEVGRGGVGGKGLVRDAAARSNAIARIAAEAEDVGFRVLRGADCAVAGAKSGNVEHFLHLKRRL